MPSLDKPPYGSTPDPQFPAPMAYGAPPPVTAAPLPGGGVPETVAAGERNWVLICYVVHVLGPFTGMLLPIVGVILNYVFFEQSRTVFARSHHRWMLRTFWFMVLWSVVALLVFMVGVGGLLGLSGRSGVLLSSNMAIGGTMLLAIVVWWWYRTILGLVRFSRNQAMYVAVPGAGPTWR